MVEINTGCCFLLFILFVMNCWVGGLWLVGIVGATWILPLCEWNTSACIIVFIIQTLKNNICHLYPTFLWFGYPTYLPLDVLLNMIFLFPGWWDMLVPWRVRPSFGRWNNTLDPNTLDSGSRRGYCTTGGPVSCVSTGWPLANPWCNIRWTNLNNICTLTWGLRKGEMF